MTTCRHCLRRRTTYVCPKKGGGSYRRGSRTYRSRICYPCAKELSLRVTPGHHLVSRWSVHRINEIVRTCETRTSNNHTTE